jgi:hypothetical protein
LNSNIFLPEKINVGFRNRDDTYTKKLAYVIYYDEKGKLRKQTSWDNWRDHSIDNVVYGNVPTSGFVLNKKVGGYDTGWDHRQTYVRVYDPRDFEFEITVPNLLYILENTSSIKGKGLDGKFVYGWDGKDLILIPTSSPDYIEISKYNKIVHSNFRLKGKDLKPGATYLTKQGEKWIYLGRFDKWDIDYDNKYQDSYGRTIYPYKNNGKAYFFQHDQKYGDGIKTIKSLSKFIEVVSEECVENYAELMDKLEHNDKYSPVDHTKDEYVPYTVTELEKSLSRWKRVYINNGEEVELRLDGKKVNCEVKNHDWNWGLPRYKEYKYNNISETVEKLQPKYLRKYLANGKLYREIK